MEVGEHINCYRYEAQLEKDWHYILGDSDSKLLIVATEAIYEKVKDYVGKVGAA
jgi:long-subunit acyl-CoA synthetase (AMP-forming)